MSKDTSRKEALGIVLFFAAIVIILIFYLPVSLTGIIGIAVKDFFFGFIGVAAYVIPVYILYVALDIFFEKRKGVSRIRVRSIILLLVSVSALLALISMDMDYFENACINEAGDASSLKALSLLWQSGSRVQLITNPSNSSPVFPGGLIGGSIAVSLYEVTGKVIGVLTIVVFLLTQVLLVFRVSIKAAARKTAHVISTASTRAYKSVVSHKSETDYGYQKYSDYNYINIEDDISGKSQFVKQEYFHQTMQGPFLTKMPVDGDTGFTDVDRLTGGKIKPVSPAPDKISYKETEFDLVEENCPSADFGYTTDPLSVPGAAKFKKKTGIPSFLDTKKEDFYDLNQDEQEEYPDSGISGKPYEVTEDAESDYPESERRVRKPVIDKSFYDKIDEGRSIERTEQSAVPIKKHTRADQVSYRQPEEYGNEHQYRYVDLRNYVPAPTRLLVHEKRQQADKDLNNKLRAKAQKLEEAIGSYGVKTKVVNITHGPRITRFELSIEAGVKLSRVTNLRKEIMLAMAAKSINIEAPIPGTSSIGIEVPNESPDTVHLRPLVETEKFKLSTPLTVALGRDISGTPIYCDIAKMPHLMIAGSTGSGKSVCLNSILTSILVHASPSEVRLILVDPKRVEFIMYNGIPHLIMPVITDAKKATGALNWALAEMQRRYQLFEEAKVRDIKGFNEKYKSDPDAEHLPLIVIVIDELADIMLVAAKEVEVYISRLAALARASGIHLIIATQRPSVNVITGSIKANIGSRIALATVSGFDSRTILDRDGAEKLLGQGDMLYAPMSESNPIRGQGAWVDDKDEMPGIINFLRSKYGSMYDESIIKDINNIVAQSEQSDADVSDPSGSSIYEDDLFDRAVMTVIENGSASTSLLQRRLGLGYPKAGRLIDELAKRNIIGPLEGSKPRKVLITMTEWLEMKARNE